MLEALWLHQSLDDVDARLLKRMLTCPEPKARAAATRVLCYWRDRVEDPLELLRKQVNDENPRVRLEAVRALSFFDGNEAAKAQEIAMESLVLPQDDYLEYTLNETNKTLDQRIRPRRAMPCMNDPNETSLLSSPDRRSWRARMPACAPSTGMRPLASLDLVPSHRSAARVDQPRGRVSADGASCSRAGACPEARQGTVIEMIGKRGTVGDWTTSISRPSTGRLPAAIRIKALDALAEAAAHS